MVEYGAASQPQPKLDLSDELGRSIIAAREPSVWAVLMCLFSIATEYNGPLEAAHAQIGDDRYDVVVCGKCGQPTLDLSDQLRGCSIASMYTHYLSSAHVLV